MAVQAIRRMRGGAQSQLMLGADGYLWVVKFRNNPQGERVLANEFLATRIAEAVGLTVPKTEVVEVSEWLVRNSPELAIDLGRGERQRCEAGLQFGSRFVGGAVSGSGTGMGAGGYRPGQVVDYLPEAQLGELRNLREFAGMLAVDKLCGNCNGRQAVFERGARDRKYRATFIDQGFCFNAGEWTFPDAALRGVYPRNCVYTWVTGWESFEPWLSRLEALPAKVLGAAAEQVPPAWYGGDPGAMEQLLEAVLARRGRIRGLIDEFRRSAREPFPRWGGVTKDCGVGVADNYAKAGILVM